MKTRSKRSRDTTEGFNSAMTQVVHQPAAVRWFRNVISYRNVILTLDQPFDVGGM